MEGVPNEARSYLTGANIGEGNLDSRGGGTLVSNAEQPTLKDYENIFGPAGRDVRLDRQRSKRHNRWHLPDALKGSNPFLADRIDGLITDTSTSPFTSYILPYHYLEQVDAKIKWNTWSFDEALASRVPYESAARTLTQTKRSYQGYTVRQGLAITLEHNFMLSQKGRENFANQLQQVVGSVQYTNDVDCHVALISCPSYAKERAEKYYLSSKTNEQIIREYVDMFGFLSKSANGMDIILEECKALLKTWGSPDADFILCNSRLTFNLAMSPDRTSYATYGPDGLKRLQDGPEVPSYRGIKIIHSRSFSLEDGMPPRDIMLRRVRVAEYYSIPKPSEPEKEKIQLYDEGRDAWVTFSWAELVEKANNGTGDPTAANVNHIVLIRPNIEHQMFGVIVGKAGEQTGATFWGQTELSCFDDSQHGIFGMSYKYNARAMVYNSRNIVRLWDVAYGGYNGGKGTDFVDWKNMGDFNEATADLNKPYSGPSIMAMSFTETAKNLPNPLVFHKANTDLMTLDGDHINAIKTEKMRLDEFVNTGRLKTYTDEMPDFSALNNRRIAGDAVQDDEVACVTMAFAGSWRLVTANGVLETAGSGHHGTDYVGCASVRAGKAARMVHPTPTLTQSYGAR